jgi:transcriptional regulator with XRE-family HTH domain
MPQKVRSESNENLRFRVDGFATLRKKLGLTANEMGTLIGVSGQSIYKWEQGKAKPRASQLQAIAAARKMGKRDVAAKLAGSLTEQA